MFSARGRSGPSKSTPANVQCQKCLKKGHYSYECKAAPQERPYVARPSRTQQLFNPKLLPKLSSDTPDALQKRKGVADEELAKKEAERARKRELEAEEEPSPRASPSKRARSYSSDSVSTISTRSPSPPPARTRVSRSPVRGRPSPSPRDPSPQAPQTRRRPSDSRDRYSSRSAESPARGYSTRVSPRRRSVSPPRPESFSRRGRPDGYSDRGHGKAPQSRREFSRSLSRSRSPARSPIRHGGRREQPRGDQYRDREDPDRRGGRNQPQRVQQRPPQRQSSPPPPPPRERSLSPFSKRLALTQAMNMKK